MMIKMKEQRVLWSIMKAIYSPDEQAQKAHQEMVEIHPIIKDVFNGEVNVGQVKDAYRNSYGSDRPESFRKMLIYSVGYDNQRKEENNDAREGICRVTG